MSIYIEQILHRLDDHIRKLDLDEAIEVLEEIHDGVDVRLQALYEDRDG